MHSSTSFVLLLASSALAIPVLNGIANAPVNVVAPVKGAVAAAANVVAPVKAAAANVDVSKVNAANDVLSGNKAYGKRVLDGVANLPVDVTAPVSAVVGAAGKVIAPVEAAAANVDVSKVNAANGVLSGNTLRLRGALTGVLNAPVDVVAPVKAGVGAAADVVAPVEAAAANVDVSKVNALNGVDSGNTVLPRVLDGVANVPVTGIAPVDAVVGAAANVVAPVEAAVGNVDVSKVNALNGVGSGNTVLPRVLDGAANVPVTVVAPVKAAVGAAADVVAPVKAAAANVDVSKVNAANGVASGNSIRARVLNGVANVPVTGIAPVDAVVGAAANVVAPVEAAAANVDVSKVNAANGVLSGNTAYGKRVLDGAANVPATVVAPVKAAVGAAANVVAPVKAAAANVDVSKVNALNGVDSGNTVLPRVLDGIANVPATVIAPVEGVVGAAANVAAPVTAAVGNVGVNGVNVGNGIASGNTVKAPSLPL